MKLSTSSISIGARVALAAAIISTDRSACAEESSPNTASVESRRSEPATEFIVRLPDVGPEAEPLPSAGQALSLAEIESLALANYPALQASQANVEAARGRWLQAGLWPNPVIGYESDDVGARGTAGKQGGFVGQEFVTAGKLGLSRAVASQQIAAADQRYTQFRLHAVLAARTDYYETLAAQRTVTLLRELQQVTTKAVEASQLRVQAQEESAASLLQTQIENDSVQLLEEEAANRYDAGRRRLLILIGRPDQPVKLDDAFAQPLPALDWESTRNRVLNESPQLAEAQFAVEAARFAVRRGSPSVCRT